MVKLTENVIYNRTKTATESVRRLNLWGCDIDDISLCANMPNLEILSLSVNRVQVLQPLQTCSNLQELYLRKNEVSDIGQIEFLKGLEQLRVLWMEENPCADDPEYRHKILRILPQLTMLDNTPVTREEVNAALGITSSTEQKQLPRSRQSSLDRSVMSSSMVSDNGPSAGVFDVIPSSSEYAYISPGGEMTASGSASQYLDCMSNSTGDSHVDQDATPVTETPNYDPLAPSTSMLSSSAVSDSATSPTTVPPPDTSSAMSPDTAAEWADFSLKDLEMSRSYHAGSSSISARTHKDHAQHPTWYSRSVSLPRRRVCSRSGSESPVRPPKNANIVAAIAVLMDELDQSSLRSVVEEAQRRIKKQR